MDEEIEFELSLNSEDISDIRPSCVGRDEEIEFQRRSKFEAISDIVSAGAIPNGVLRIPGPRVQKPAISDPSQNIDPLDSSDATCPLLLHSPTPLATPQFIMVKGLHGPSGAGKKSFKAHANGESGVAP